MIVLTPRIIQEYRCEFCTRKYQVVKIGMIHEQKCYRNPNRDCFTCNNTGKEDYGSSNEGIRDIRDCSSCIIAKFLGGKSYIQ